MNVLDLIGKSAVMLNIPEVVNEDFSLITVENENEILNQNFAFKRLYEFSKLVLNEVNSYLPKVKEVECKAQDKKILLSQLEGLSKIVAVKNQFGYIKYSIVDNSIKVDEDGTYIVVFNQCPQIKSMFDKIEQYDNSLGEDLFVYGLNSYYCLATGLFEEFNIYNAHYAERLAALKNLKVFAMPCRSWQ